MSEGWFVGVYKERNSREKWIGDAGRKKREEHEARTEPNPRGLITTTEIHPFKIQQDLRLYKQMSQEAYH